jgi:hypothetical protein
MLGGHADHCPAVHPSHKCGYGSPPPTTSSTLVDDDDLDAAELRRPSACLRKRFERIKADVKALVGRQE